MRDFKTFVTWPSSHITELIETALRDIAGPEVLSTDEPDEDTDPGHLLQWSTYDSLVHSLTLDYPTKVLSSSYTIRKALIRKHFLHRTVVNYLAKTPESVLKKTVPRTWPIEISFADELDELWSDELWDLSTELEESKKWFILKPGMADRGQGIRMFNTKGSLYTIFQSFEDESSDEEDEEEGEMSVQREGNDKTTVMTSQLRHFVIQEYLSSPLLFDPSQANLDPSSLRTTNPEGRKFHLRVYCVASGALKLFMCPNILALFAGTTYTPPSLDPEDDPEDMDLSPHLTNTALQENADESSVRLLKELVGCSILSGSDPNSSVFSLEDVQDIEDQVADVLAETFKAALASVVHFQVLPNAFELFGADLLVTHAPASDSGSSKFQVSLLEINAEPAIELTGARLNWILVDLFKGIAHTCIRPFFEANPQADPTAQGTEWLRKCLDVEVRGYK
ncbi:tubulin-tyrosine ligase [Ceratobasidium sp. AG-I]|nr:tubulin-tyrosine ligase [Ceratobasidium sp. AG-I]